ncbi:MAG: hypothetical protein MJZ31_12315 [Bacteroidales bacterium]|nr:hypothetical protein [Bacteroidales bacterium]
MSEEQFNEEINKLKKALEIAEYEMLRSKAMKNETIIQSDNNNGYREVSAREVFTQLYNEPVPSY